MQGDFIGVEGTNTEGFSDGQLQLGIETVDGTAGIVRLGPLE
jgi:hypothetical protein